MYESEEIMNLRIGANYGCCRRYNQVQQQMGQDPNQYLQRYASENGISTAKAKEELRTKYGDPSAQGIPNSESLFNSIQTPAISNGNNASGNTQPWASIGQGIQGFTQRIGGMFNQNRPSNVQPMQPQQGGQTQPQQGLMPNMPPAGSQPMPMQPQQGGQMQPQQGNPFGGFQNPQAQGNPFGNFGMQPVNPNQSQNNQGIDPDSYAKQYASLNNIDFAKAKEELKAKYGDPKAPNESSLQNNQGIDPDDYAKQYASINNIDIAKAKEELKAKYGDPKALNEVSSSDSSNPFRSETDDCDSTDNKVTAGVNPEQQALLNKGIPLEVIQQGDDAIRKYAKDNNITLEKPIRK